MIKNLDLYEKNLISRLKKDDRIAFESIFTTHYKDLVSFAFGFLKDKVQSEEVVQNMFVKFWEERRVMQIQCSLKSYFLKSVQNRCLDIQRHNKIKDTYRKY